MNFTWFQDLEMARSGSPKWPVSWWKAHSTLREAAGQAGPGGPGGTWCRKGHFSTKSWEKTWRNHEEGEISWKTHGGLKSIFFFVGFHNEEIFLFWNLPFWAVLVIWTDYSFPTLNMAMSVIYTGFWTCNLGGASPYHRPWCWEDLESPEGGLSHDISITKSQIFVAQIFSWHTSRVSIQIAIGAITKLGLLPSHGVAAASVLHHQRRHLGIAIATGAAGGLQDALSMLSPCCCDVAQWNECLNDHCAMGISWGFMEISQ